MKAALYVRGLPFCKPSKRPDEARAAVPTWRRGDELLPFSSPISVRRKICKQRALGAICRSRRKLATWGRDARSSALAAIKIAEMES